MISRVLDSTGLTFASTGLLKPGAWLVRRELGSIGVTLALVIHEDSVREMKDDCKMKLKARRNKFEKLIWIFSMRLLEISSQMHEDLRLRELVASNVKTLKS